MAIGRQLLKQAFKNGNEKAVDFLIRYGFIKQRKDLEAELVNMGDEEVTSQIALSSNGFNVINNIGMGTNSRKNQTIEN